MAPYGAAADAFPVRCGNGRKSEYVNQRGQHGPSGMVRRSQAAHVLSCSLQGYPESGGQHLSQTHPAKCGRAE